MEVGGNAPPPIYGKKIKKLDRKLVFVQNLKNPFFCGKFTDQLSTFILTLLKVLVLQYYTVL